MPQPVNLLQIPSGVERFLLRRASQWRYKDEQVRRNLSERIQVNLLRGMIVNGVVIPDEVITIIFSYSDNKYWLVLLGMFSVVG